MYESYARVLLDMGEACSTRTIVRVCTKNTFSGSKDATGKTPPRTADDRLPHVSAVSRDPFQAGLALCAAGAVPQARTAANSTWMISPCGSAHSWESKQR